MVVCVPAQPTPNDEASQNNYNLPKCLTCASSWIFDRYSGKKMFMMNRRHNNLPQLPSRTLNYM
jgi:hypothetical protein